MLRFSVELRHALGTAEVVGLPAMHRSVLRSLDLHCHPTHRVDRGRGRVVGMRRVIMPGVAASVFHDLLSIPCRGMIQAMDEKIKKSQLARLSRIEGQVRGVARMIEENRYCIDVLTQIKAVRAALDKVEQETLSDHLRHCVAHAFHAGSARDRQTKIDELIAVLDNRGR